MIGRTGKETKRGEPKPTAVLRFLLGLVGMVIITISESLPESAYSKCLRFALVDGAESINCVGDAFTGGDVFTGVGFSL